MLNTPIQVKLDKPNSLQDLIGKEFLKIIKEPIWVSVNVKELKTKLTRYLPLTCTTYYPINRSVLVFLYGKERIRLNP